MKDKMAVNKKIVRNPWIFLTIVFAIAASATPLSSLYYAQTVICYFIISFFYFLKRGIKQQIVVKRTPLIYTIVLPMLIMTTCIFNRDVDVTYYFGLILQILGSWLVVECNDEEDFSKAYINILVFISFYSTILTFLFNICRDLLQNLPLVYAEGENLASWRTLYYIYNVWDIYARFSIVRNSACFREPGVWGAFVAIGLIIKISQIKSQKYVFKIDILELLILFVGAATSLSTTAFFCIILCCVIYFINIKPTKRQYFIFINFVSVIIMLIIRFHGLLFDKLKSGSTSYISLMDRIQSISLSIESWISSPLFGAGYTNYFKIVTRGVNSVSFLFVLGEFGPLVLVLFLSMLFRWVRKREFNLFSTLVVCFQLVIILNTQNLIFTPLFMILMFYGTVKKELHHLPDKSRTVISTECER